MSNLPSPKELILEVPLYKKFELNNENIQAVAKLTIFNEPLDVFCPQCDKESVYTMSDKPQYKSVKEYLDQNIHDKTDPIGDKNFIIRYQCSREIMHKAIFCFMIVEKNLVKIGQFPSLADFELNVVPQYKKVLNKVSYGDLTRAIGLNAHGIGVGAFIYLRRIFERLVEEAHQDAMKQTEWNEEKYTSTNRMIDKVPMLKNFLPSNLQKMKAVYSILSKGVHSLSEDECLSHFNLLMKGIELILQQKIEKENEAQKKMITEKTKIELNKLKKKLK